MAKIRSKSSHISVNMLIINACHLLACHIPGPGGPRGAIPWGHPAPRPPPSRQQLAGPVNETDSHPVCPHSVLPPVYALRGGSEFQPPRLDWRGLVIIGMVLSQFRVSWSTGYGIRQ